MSTPRLIKALSEKIYLLSAVQNDTNWVFTVRGQTNNIYEQTLTSSTFSCSCPDHQSKQTSCKHLLFLVARVACQMELASTWCQRPKTTWNTSVYEACAASWKNRLSHLVSETIVSAKKEGSCSICFEDMNPTDTLVECKSTCHNWFHEDCMTKWLSHDHTTCPLCRSEWNASQKSEDEKIKGSVTEEKTQDILTDLVISFDTTGSMYPCLAEVRRNIEAMVRKLFLEIPGLRLSIISHGDYCDKDKVINVLDFTTDQSVIETFIRDAPQTGGGDYPECYELVLRTTRNLSWRPDAKMKSLVLIGDAPPHSKNETPDKIDWLEEAEALHNRNIQIFSVQCLNHGNREAFAFYSKISEVTNGYHVFLDQFSYIKDMIQAICFKQYNTEQLEQFEKDVQSGSGGMSQTLRLMFDTLLGKKSREEVQNEMNPDRFHERYRRPARAARSHTTESAAPDMSHIDELRPCHPSKFQVFSVDEDSGIQDFCRKMGITFAKGKGFYEFTKPEIIQPQKEIVLMDRVSGELYEGDAARTIAGIKKNEERSKIKPGDIPKYRVFIQSTSPNRKLIGGQGFLYEVMEST
jgi:hypothetical protein